MNITTRKEERYIIETSRCEEFVDGISSISHPNIFPTDYNHTLYFNNFEHELPFEASIKARRYSAGPFNGRLEPAEEWIFEIKKDIISEKFRLREKQRKELTLEAILEELFKIREIDKNPITLPLRPYVADSYRREHYIINGEDNFRITIDDNLIYYFFEQELNGEEIGREDYKRVEIKIP